MKTGECVELYNRLGEFISKDIDLPLQMAWDLDDNYEALKKVNEKFEKKQAELLKPLQEKGAFEPVGDKGNFKVQPEYKDEFTAAMEKINGLLGTENEITIKKAKRDDLPGTISAKDLRALKFMIK